MRKYLLILFLLLTTLASATNYYVKNGGNNALTGLSDAQAWETIAYVNSKAFVHGDTIFFKKGSTWRMTDLVCDPGTAAGDVTYTSYGTGAKPLILGSKQENSTGDWADQGGNLWRNTDASFTTEVGNLIFNNEASCAVRKTSLGAVDAQGDYYYNAASDYITLYSVGNPATFYTNIECALKSASALVTLWDYDYITIDGLDLRYGGRHGIAGAVGNNHITIRNCNVSWMGGATDASRLGNGIEFYGSCSNILVENDSISNIYDSGITSQLVGGAVTISNYVIRNNIFNKCDMSFEWWYWSTSGTVSGIYFENNTSVDAGKGWSHAQKISEGYGNYHGEDVYSSFMDATCSNLYIRNNIFSGALSQSLALWPAAITAITFDYNLFYTTTIAQVSGYINYTTIATWRAASGDDAHSLSGDPVFVSATDFRLQVTSPAKDVALSVGIVYDYGWSPRDATPDMGAYEYGGTPEPPPPALATVTTAKPVINLSALTASGGGEVVWDGNDAVTDRGVCWNTTANPVVTDSHTHNGSGEGAFTSSLTSLVTGITYHVRAYAINGVGTSYGEDLTFTMSESLILVHNGKGLYHNGKILIISGGGEELSAGETAIRAGNTVAWYRSDVTATITKDVQDSVSVWADYLGSGRNLLATDGTGRSPIWSADGLLFNGVKNYMQTAAFTWNQPCFIYIVMKQVTYTESPPDYLFDGITTAKAAVYQYNATPKLTATAGTASGYNSDLAVNTWGILRVLFNGANSKIQVNASAAVTGDFGAGNAGGFTLGARPQGTPDRFGNIQVKEIVLRNVVDSAPDEAAIYAYLKAKYGL